MSGDAPPANAQPPADTDSTSGCSADGTDSGRGGSEEGDMQMSSANMQMSQHGGNMPTPAHYGMHRFDDIMQHNPCTQLTRYGFAIKMQKTK